MKTYFDILDTNTLLESPIFISGHTRTGTSLLLKLLDNSNNIISPPGRAKLNILRRLMQDSGSPNEVPEERTKRLLNILELRLPPIDEKSFNIVLRESTQLSNEIGYKADIKVILNAILQYSKNSNKNHLKYWIEKNHNLEFYWNRAVLAFANPYLLLMVRDPRDVWSSWKIECNKKGLDLSEKQVRRNIQQHLIEEIFEKSSGLSRFGNSKAINEYFRVPRKKLQSLQKCIEGVLHEGIHSSYVNEEIIDLGEYNYSGTEVGGFCWNYSVIMDRMVWLEKIFSSRVTIIIYEELVEEVNRILTQINKKLKITVDNNITPTDLGEDWKGNSSYTNEIKGVSNESIERWKNHVPAREIDIIEKLVMPKYLEHFKKVESR